jgi:hypothetical protein
MSHLSLKDSCLKVINIKNINLNEVTQDVRDLIYDYNTICWYCGGKQASAVNWGGCFNSRNRGFISVLCKKCHDRQKSSFRYNLTHCFSCFKYFTIFEISLSQSKYINIFIRRYCLDSGDYTNLCDICIMKVINYENKFKFTHIENKTKEGIKYIPISF